MISALHDIIDIWYHSQYHMQNHIWYHDFDTMISQFWIYDICITWYHRFYDIMYDLTYDIIVSPFPPRWSCQMANKMAIKWFQCEYTLLHRRAWQRREAELGRGWEHNEVFGRAWQGLEPWQRPLLRGAELGSGEERTLAFMSILAQRIPHFLLERVAILSSLCFPQILEA